MIRSVATLFAKKTAVVAVSGVVILGGATLALAEATDEVPAEDPPCVDVAETVEDECATTDTTVPEEESCDDAATTDVVEECETETTEPEPEAEPVEEVAETVYANHGAAVSEAAKGGGECAGLTGRDKGQCVAGVARSDAGKGGEETADEPAEEETVVEEEPVVEDAPAPTETETETDTAEAQIETAKPGKGNGGGGKGNGKKG